MEAKFTELKHLKEAVGCFGIWEIRAKYACILHTFIKSLSPKVLINLNLILASIGSFDRISSLPKAFYAIELNEIYTYSIE